MRKHVWIVRIGFLGVTAVLMVAAVQVRRGHEAREDLRHVVGVTSQGEYIEFGLDGHARPHKFRVQLRTSCTNRTREPVMWIAVDDGPARFDWDGERLRARESGRERYPTGWRARFDFGMRARVPDDEALEGHVWSVWHWRNRRGDLVICSSQAVAFAAGPDARRRLRPLARGWR